MHELPLVRNLLTLILDRAEEAEAEQGVAIELSVGELCDAQPDWIGRYFRLAAKGTIAEDAELRFSVSEARSACSACGREFRPSLGTRARIRCPFCGSDECGLSGGMDYRINSMEVR